MERRKFISGLLASAAILPWTYARKSNEFSFFSFDRAGGDFATFVSVNGKLLRRPNGTTLQAGDLVAGETYFIDRHNMTLSHHIGKVE